MSADNCLAADERKFEMNASLEFGK